MKKLLILCLLIFMFKGNLSAQNHDAKPRVIVMTDGEVDDHSSMIRFLLYSCDVDVLAIIETNSMFQRYGHSKEDWYENQLKAYKQVYPNLIKHNPDYPSYEKLKSISYIGDEDYDHLKDTRKLRWDLVPGYKITFKPDNWPDTPGSDAIVDILLENNPAPVYLQAWGGGNTAARAFYKLKTEYPDQYDKAISKVVMYNIWYQDGAGNYIERTHPKVTMVHCASFAGTWNYRSQKKTYDLIENQVKKNHGPLGALYPQDYVSEGDSPAFLYSLENGLRNYENPAYGGWGGRFKKFKHFENVYVDAEDDGDKKKSLRRWVDDANNDFHARMDWCVATDYKDVNHAPNAILKGKNDITVKSGKKIKLDAGKSFDPDGNAIQFSWWQYKDAGSYKGSIELINSEKAKSYFVAPKVSKAETIHIILKLTDNGSPVMNSYQRKIITIVP